MNESNESDYTVPALARGLKILEMFHYGQRILATQDFADHLGVTPAAIYRIVQTLTDMGYLHKIARNTYELGPGVLSRGFAYLSSRDLVDVAAPVINQLRDETSVSCHLAIRDGRDSVYIYRALASQRMAVNVSIGTRLPCHATALGRVLLAALDEGALGQLYAGVQLDSHAPPVPQTLPELRNRLAAERSAGLAINESDYATAIAAPIHNHAGQVIAALNISGPDRLLQQEAIRTEASNKLLATAARISQALGYQSATNPAARYPTAR